MFERDHKVARKSTQIWKECAPCVEGEDSESRLAFQILKGNYGIFFNIILNLELKIATNWMWNVNRKPGWTKDHSC